MGEEEKNYIIRQADMYIYGKSLREIAEIIGKSHITVRNNLTKKLRYADAIKYKIVMEKLEYNKEKSIEDEEVRTRILDAYELLVLKNKTVSEIAADLGTTDNIIYRDLSERLQELNKVAPDIITNDMVKKVAETLRNHSIRNNPYLVFKQEREKQTKMKNRLNKMFPRKDRQINFLTNCALTYGLRVETIADFFGDNPTDLLRDFQSGNSLYNNLSNVFKHGMKPQQEAVAEFENFFERLTKASINKDKEKTFDDLVVKNIKYYESVEKVFKFGMKRQEDAIKNFVDFFTNLIKAYEGKNKTEIANILNELSDKKAICIAKRSDSKGKKLADEQILTILKYQIKYMLETKSIARIFNIDRGTYSSRVRNLGPEYANLISDFDYLSDFYHNASLASRGIK